MTRRILCGITVFLLLLAAFCPAGGLVSQSAADLLSFEWHTEEAGITISITENSNGSQVLFLPGACDGTLTAVLNGGADVYWDGKLLEDGDLLDVSGWIGKTARVTGEGIGETEVRVMRGSAVSSLFFRIAEEDWKRVHNNKRLDIQNEMSLVMVNAAGSTEVSDTLTSFHMHGNSTVYGLKKPYQFKLQHKASLDGMGKGKTWMLLANWFDVSLVRNQITFDLCRELGLSGTPDCSQVDVYFNGKYNGTYLLTEKIQLRKDRLEISDMEEELEALNGDGISDAKRLASNRYATNVLKYFDVQEPQDITGGFLLEIEKALHFTKNERDAGFVTDGKMCIVIKEPSRPGLQAANYIADLVNQFHNAVLAKDGICPATGKLYSEYIDMHSFAVKIAVEELSANYDVRAGSQFMYKDSDRVDSLLYAGPGWDYDLTYGNKEDGLLNPLRRDYVYNRSNATSQLYHYLLDHRDFASYTRRVFEQEMLPAVEILLGKRKAPEGSALRSLREYRAAVRDSAEMNFTRWNTRLIADITDGSGRTFADAADYLRDWIARRSGMMESEWLVGGN